MLADLLDRSSLSPDAGNEKGKMGRGGANRRHLLALRSADDQGEIAILIPGLNFFRDAKV